MDDETIGTDETSIIEEEVFDLTEENEEDETDWKAEALKEKERADNQKIRAEKAEQKAKTEKQGTEKAPAISTTDFYALMTAQVAQEDIQEVQDYAAFKKISIADALKAPAIKSILADRKEERNVAEATNSGRVRRQAQAPSSDAILSDASKGKLPETEEGLNRLAEARLERRRDALKRT